METWLIVTIVLTLAFSILGVLVATLHKRISRLTQGHTNNKTLESIIIDNNHSLVKIKEQIQELSQQIQDLHKDAESNIQNIGVVRFNPFKETGGNQSFAVALTDKKNNGVIISSLYAREQMRVFAKPIVQGTSQYALTDEEQKALEQAY